MAKPFTPGPLDPTEINANASPAELAELNKEDARKFDVILGVVANEMPARLEYIQTLLDDVKTKCSSLKTTTVSFSPNINLDNVKTSYKSFLTDIVSFSAAYEIELISIFNLFENQNGMDDSIDYNYFKAFPVLGSILFTVATYFGNGNKFDDAPQIAMGVFSALTAADFNKSMRSFSYSGIKYVLKTMKMETMQQAGIASFVVTIMEGVGILLDQPDPRERDLRVWQAVGNGTKLFLGTAWASYAAAPLSATAATTVAGYLGGGAVAKGIGFCAGGLLGIGVAYVGGVIISSVVDPIVDRITGENLIEGTSIPVNGGNSVLYSKYLREAEKNSVGFVDNARNTTLYGVTVSSEYAKKLAQIDPISAIKGVNYGPGYVNQFNEKTLNDYIEKLVSIPKDAPDYRQQVDILTEETLIGGGNGLGSELVRDLIVEFEFDPYEYAINN